MIDRLSTFSDPEISDLIKTRFIAATDNDWYNRRRKDEVGRFFASLVEQHPHPRSHHTKQGHYIFTPSGKLLGFNNNRGKNKRMAFIREALAKWDKLPEIERRAGAVEVAKKSALKLDPKYHTEPPKGGVVLVSTTRALKVVDGDQLAICNPEDLARQFGYLAAIDRMWIQKSEWEELLAIGKQGGSVPERLAKRLVRYHLHDNTRGEPQPWKSQDVKSVVLKIKPDGENQFRLSGKVTTDAGERGFECALTGRIRVGKDARPTKFRLTVLGDHWGDGRYAKGARPGKSPLAITFKLADMTIPENRIRPEASFWLPSYWEAEK